MSEVLFDIFGDHHTRNRNAGQPLYNNENMGKTVKAVSNTPMKKADHPKKSFLSNTGMGLQQSTPAKNAIMRNVFSQLIYNDADIKKSYKDEYFHEELEFTRPQTVYDNVHMDVIDHLFSPMKHNLQESPPSTPSLYSQKHDMEFDYLSESICLTDNTLDASIPYEEDDLIKMDFSTENVLI